MAQQSDGVGTVPASGKDWRVKLSLAPDSNYLYNASAPGILSPLKITDGVIFPYTPKINIVYAANYDAQTPVHSNFKIQQYVNSAVDTLTLSCQFTSQDTKEANYLLAVIHFFRSMTKMFYGQDEDPKNGTPPPLAFLTGLGAFQFEGHPLAITNFSYNLPDNVDYIHATNTLNNTDGVPQNLNLIGGQLQSGGGKAPATYPTAGNAASTFVPTKITITIQCIPIVTRKQISEEFSLKDYAQGRLLQGSKLDGGGIW